jgi:hypothetical protein
LFVVSAPLKASRIGLQQRGQELSRLFDHRHMRRIFEPELAFFRRFDIAQPLGGERGGRQLLTMLEEHRRALERSTMRLCRRRDLGPPATTHLQLYRDGVVKRDFAAASPCSIATAMKLLPKRSA